MSQRIIQGSLRLSRQDLFADLPLIKEHFLNLSEPQFKRSSIDERQSFWSVDFTARQEQWWEIEPKLLKMGIEASVYEMPGNYLAVRRAEERQLARIDQRNKRVGVALLVVALLTVVTIALAVSTGSEGFYLLVLFGLPFAAFSVYRYSRIKL